jgi:membrane-associated phospholipid phosphatase
MLYQVKMVRPEIVGNDIFDIWVRWLYSMDPTALNCFPSIHSVVGTMMVIGGLNNDKVLFPKWLSVLSVIFGVGCALSTVFIKQHYFIDMVVGAIIAIVVYTIVFLIDKKICKKKN